MEVEGRDGGREESMERSIHTVHIKASGSQVSR